MPQNYVSILLSSEKRDFGVLGLDNLTSRELEILECFVNCMADKAIAKELGISFRTVEAHKRNIKNKVGVRNMMEIYQILYALSQEQ